MSFKKPIKIPAKVIPKKEQYAVIAEIIWYLLQKDTNLLFFDPCHMQHNLVPAKMWQKKGKSGTISLKSNSGRKRVNILGAFDFNNFKTITTLTEESCNSERIVEFFTKIKSHYPKNQEIVIILDNASYNRSYYTTKYAEYYGLELYFLPPYSPNLNLIERLWKFCKSKLIYNKYYEKFDEFKNSIINFFEEIDNYKLELETLLTLKFQIFNAE